MTSKKAISSNKYHFFVNMKTKDRIIFFLLSVVFSPSLAQTVIWQEQPLYDNIEFYDGVFYMGSKADSCFIWNMEGKLLHSSNIKLEIAPFHENVCVVQEEGTDNLYGFITAKGAFNKVEKKYRISDGHPYFHNARLRVQDEAGDCYYLDCEGTNVGGPFVKAYPFSQGYALVTKYKNEEKKKDEYYDYLCANKNEAFLPGLDRKDIGFASSFNDEGYAILVLDKKVMRLNANDGSYTQMYTDDTMNKKSRVFTQVSRPLLEEHDEKYPIYLKQGEMVFDNLMQLEEIRYVEQPAIHIRKDETKPYEYHSYLEPFQGGNNLYGLTLNHEDLLPAQFKSISQLCGYLAIVEFIAPKGPKWGVLKVNPEDKIEFELNDGEEIPFKHATFKTSVKMLMPTYMDNKLAFVESGNSINRCDIKKDTREEIENPQVRGIKYNCTLHLPEVLTSDVACINYSFNFNYDHIKSKEYEICASGWFVMAYKVEVDQAQIEVDSDAEEVEIGLKLSKSGLIPDNDIHKPFVTVADENEEELYCYEQSVDSYFVRIPILDQDKLTFKVYVNEENCPTVEYPITITVNRETPVTDSQAPVKKTLLLKKEQPKAIQPIVIKPRPVY